MGWEGLETHIYYRESGGGGHYKTIKEVLIRLDHYLFHQYIMPPVEAASSQRRKCVLLCWDTKGLIQNVKSLFKMMNL